MEVEGVDGGMESRRKSKMIPGFVRVTGSNGTVYRNKDFRKRYCCIPSKVKEKTVHLILEILN